MVREGLATQKGYLAREARLMADYDRGEMNMFRTAKVRAG